MIDHIAAILEGCGLSASVARSTAVSILLAMREPTAAIDAGNGHLIADYQEMIDAMLNEDAARP